LGTLEEAHRPELRVMPMKIQVEVLV